MTTKEKAQAYDEALKKARDYYEKGYMMINAALVNIFPNIKEPSESLCHIWTIQDAKDGDILCKKDKNCPFIYDKNRYNNGLAYYYAGIDVYGNLKLKNPFNLLYHFGKLREVCPATKEQRDLLFQKMKEAGYEWDAEKKELKKIKQ